MISRRFWQNFGPSARVFGRIPLRQIFRISLLTLAFVSLTGAQDQGSSAPAQQTEEVVDAEEREQRDREAPADPLFRER